MIVIGEWILEGDVDAVGLQLGIEEAQGTRVNDHLVGSDVVGESAAQSIRTARGGGEANLNVLQGDINRGASWVGIKRQLRNADGWVLAAPKAVPP